MVSQQKLLGVCAWLARKYDADVRLLRSLFVASLIPALGSSLLVYLVLAVLKPKFG